MGQIVDSSGKPIVFGEVSGKQQEVFECSVCKVRIQHGLVQNGPTFKATVNTGTDKKPVDVEFPRVHYIYRCCGCQTDTYFLIQQQHTFRVTSPGISQNATWPTMVLHRYPRSIPEAHDVLPKGIKQNLIEAETCLAARAPNAAGTMARRAVDEIVRLHKATGKDLYNRLENLRSAGLVSKELIDIAHQIRSAGRNGAHAEWQELTMEQARTALFLLKEMIREIYITPAERKQRLQSLTKLKKKP